MNKNTPTSPRLNKCVRFKPLMQSAVLAGLVTVCDWAAAAPVTYGFDYEITSNTYRGWTGPFLAEGTKGTGTVVLEYQTVDQAGGVATDVNANYTAAPFSINLGSGSNALRSGDSSDSTRFIGTSLIVQDIPDWGMTYDTISIEGAGSAQALDAAGHPILLSLTAQLALFAPSNAISDHALSAENIEQINNLLIDGTLNIRNWYGYGQVNGKVANFRLLTASQAVPEPGTAWLLGFGGLGIWRLRKSRRPRDSAV